MLDNTTLSVKVWGAHGCFTRPDLKVERMSYPCITASAARAVLESILWKPEFQWVVRRILILNPVTFLSVKRNEINKRQGKNPIIIENDHTPRNSIILKNPAYIIEASIWQAETNPANPPQKYIEMFRRRVQKGQCYRRPYLGTRECSAEFAPADAPIFGVGNTPIADTLPIGSMFYDMAYAGDGRPTPLFIYDAAINGGILDLSKAPWQELVKSSHIRPKQSPLFANTLSYFKETEEAEND